MVANTDLRSLTANPPPSLAGLRQAVSPPPLNGVAKRPAFLLLGVGSPVPPGNLPAVDWLNLMSYDSYDGAAADLDEMLGYGIPAGKLVLGLPTTVGKRTPVRGSSIAPDARPAISRRNPTQSFSWS